MAVRTFRVTTAYDGTAYAGWQRQEAVATVQAAFESALTEIEGRHVAVAGAGRTDAGVHARGQVASFQLSHGITPSALQRALNAKLPRDIRVLEAQEAPPTFHARFSATGKVYRYRVDRGAVADPLELRYAWHVPGVLDTDAMSRAGRAMVGCHDFAAFQTAASESGPRSTVRTIRALNMEPTGGIWTIDVEGDGFLRHMVRTMVGTLVEVGRGRWSPDEITAILASGRRERAGPTAPAHGLFLLRVDFARA